MRAFFCHQCHQQLVFFDNSRCVHCGASLGFALDRNDVVALRDLGQGRFASVGPATSLPGHHPDVYRRCANEQLAGCNWLVPEAENTTTVLCASCRLTRTRPNDNDATGLAAFAKAEGAKRQLLFQLAVLGLPVVSRHDDPKRGLAFDLLTSDVDSVVIGHAGGVITLNLAESNDAYRERTRQHLGEAYRTLLGHFRHEIGHYFWDALIADGPRLAEFRSRFGDERHEYGAAIERHYDDEEGPLSGWEQHYVSAYATMHPWEDWAETFAHYLHIRDTLQTAEEFGLILIGPKEEGERRIPELATPHHGHPTEPDPFHQIIAEWLPLTYALNAMNRSMGKPDLYPFVLATAVIGKLGFIHSIVAEVGTAR